MLAESASSKTSLKEAVSVSLSNCVKPESTGEANDEVIELVMTVPVPPWVLFNGSSKIDFMVTGASSSNAREHDSWKPVLLWKKTKFSIFASNNKKEMSYRAYHYPHLKFKIYTL